MKKKTKVLISIGFGLFALGFGFAVGICAVAYYILMG